MSFGFLATNNNGEVLISSDTRNLHFLVKNTNPTVSNSGSSYGGFKELTYTITSSYTPVPFFTIPTNDYYGVVGVKNTSGTTWTIKLIKSGTGTTYPDLYVFADARGVSSTESYGMKVMLSDGSASFDSRKEPLVVTGGASVTHPSNPLTTAITGLSAFQCSSGTTHSEHTPDNESSGQNVGTLSSTPIFHYSSLAQAERRANFQGTESTCIGFSYGSCIGFEETDAFISTYWAFYRGGIRLSGTNVFAGWITVLGGCFWSTNQGSNILGIDTSNESSAGGSFPYSNETLNLASTAVIVADGTRYD